MNAREQRRSPRILVVEDSPDQRLILEALLVHHGYRVASAADGRHGLEAALRDPPDCFLLDLSLPGLDGVQITERLRADPRTAHIPIVLMTAFPELFLSRTRALGVPLLVKPVAPALLLDALNRALGPAGGGAAESPIPVG